VNRAEPQRISYAGRFSSGGFTLLELLVVSMLMVSVVVMTARFWRTLSLSMSDLTARAKMAEEMRFLVENISRDFGPAVGAAVFDGDQLLICQDGGDNPNGLADWGEPDVIVEYFISNGQLRRFDRSAATESTVGDSISTFVAEKMPNSSIQLMVELQQDDVVRHATFTWSAP
jgi:hypothetical protein